ncbi:MAG TPA: HlyD family efflux transporter periplasmic adaptor subunit [Burkholderiaceae bacterium]|nr:HlyD family efflux transporter periplasmic adaptor subunit [Burkholderiaceae bacterium]
MAAQFSRTTRALAHDHSRLSFALWLVGLVLLGGWLTWFGFGQVTLYEVSRQARIEVQQAAHPVSALMPSRIVSNALTIGQEVRAGDVLVELDASTERLRLAEETMRLAGIPGRIESLRKEIGLREQAEAKEQRAAVAARLAARFRIDEAEATVSFARDQERRLREESQFGSVPKVEAQRAATEASKSAAVRDGLGADLRRMESDAQTRTSQNQAQIETLNRSVVELQAEMATSRATISRLESDIARHLIRAPIDGRIGDVLPLRAGAVVAAGQKLASVVPRGAFIVVGEFSPSSVLGRIRPGQLGRMRLDGYPWAQYGTIAARVTRVGSDIRDNLVRVEFEPDPASAARIVLQHGLPGSVEVSVDQTVPALLVLRTAGQWFAGTARAAPAAAVTASPDPPVERAQ